MLGYIMRRLLLMIPTLFGILLINFAIVQAAPGGPVEQAVARLTNPQATNASSRAGGPTTEFGAATSGVLTSAPSSVYRGAQGIDPDLLAQIKTLYGFDKPPLERFTQMIKNYLQLDFGTSFFRDASVLDLVLEKLPVSVSLGLWTTLLVYLISIPLGIKKAMRDGSAFDTISSAIIIIGQAIPAFLFAILLLILFAGGSYFQWFPLRGITSDNFAQLSLLGKIGDYLWHITLPVISMVISGFASLTFLTKNSFIDEIAKQYVLTARAKGLSERRVLYGHVFRNAMLIVITGLPMAFLSIFFTSSLLIEFIFSLDGLGLLSFESAITRDYPVMFGTLFMFSMIGLLFKLLSDILAMLVDPRIDFARRG